MLWKFVTLSHWVNTLQRGLRTSVSATARHNVPIDDAARGTMRHVQRMREINVQAMVEGTAQSRVKRALATKTRPAGQSFEYKKR